MSKLKKLKKWGKRLHIGLSEKEKQRIFEKRQMSKARMLEREKMKVFIAREKVALAKAKAKRRKFEQKYRPKHKPGIAGSGLVLGGGNDFFSTSKKGRKK